MGFELINSNCLIGHDYLVPIVFKCTCSKLYRPAHCFLLFGHRPYRVFVTFSNCSGLAHIPDSVMTRHHSAKALLELMIRL